MKSRFLSYLQIAKCFFYGGGLLLFVISAIMCKYQPFAATVLYVMAIVFLGASGTIGFISKEIAKKISDEFEGTYNGIFSYQNAGLVVVNFISLFLVPFIFTMVIVETMVLPAKVITFFFGIVILVIIFNFYYTSSSFGVYSVCEDGIEVMWPFMTRKYTYNEVRKCAPKIESHTSRRSPRVNTYITVLIKTNDGREFKVCHVVDNDVVSNMISYQNLMEKHRDSKMANYINDHIDIARKNP